jgi:hypothetical protein
VHITTVGSKVFEKHVWEVGPQKQLSVLKRIQSALWFFRASNFQVTFRGATFSFSDSVYSASIAT